MAPRKAVKPDPSQSILPEFQLGDIVYLKSGSPAMTVDGIWNEGRLRTVYYDGSDYIKQYFTLQVLTHANPYPCLLYTSPSPRD